MWLLPLQTRIATLAVRLFYRFKVEGSTVPESGAVLLVANHPNTLLDPASVAAAARRPVRFLAKATLFRQPIIGGFFSATGAIPVYRRQDDPGEVGKNEEMFKAVQAALVEGAAIGIFPEGKSHGEPALAPLRTGAARMALGAAAVTGRSFPIIPVGLTVPRKEFFRSEALAIIGDGVKWQDLANRGEDDEAAVRELTRRIDESLREVTLNLEQWEDAPAIASAESIYAAEYRLSDDPDDQLQRMQAIAQALTRLRSESPERVTALYQSVSNFRRTTEKLGIEADHLSMRLHPGVALWWTVKRVILLLVTGPFLLAGVLIFYLPYRFVGWLDRRTRLGKEARGSLKLVAGFFVFLLWISFFVALAWWKIGQTEAIIAAVALPVLAVLTLFSHERVSESFDEARRFLLLLRRKSVRETLRGRRKELAAEIEKIRVELESNRAKEVARPEVSLPS